MKNLNREENARARIRSAVWDFLNANGWRDPDDFSLDLSNRFYDTSLPSSLSAGTLLEALGRIRTSFFMVNKVSKKQFTNLLLSDIGNKLLAITAEAHTPVSSKVSETIKILFLASNPDDAVGLKLDKEVREIESKVLLAQRKDQLILVKKGAVRIGDLQFHLNQERPTIVHFSGHGTNDGRIVFEDNSGNARAVPPRALARVFKVLRDNIRCVVLNACFSSEQAEAISQHIDCVVGMSSSISDDAAIAFSTAFYLGIASERSVKNAFDQGINELMLWGIPEEHVPRLLSRGNIDSSKVHLLAPISPKVNSSDSKKVIVHSKRRNHEPFQFIEGIIAHLFFPADTAEENRTSSYHERHLHHKVIVNHKTHPPKAYYMTRNSDGWRFIMEYPECWVSETVTDEGYETDDPNFTKRWCNNNGYSLKRKIAETKDLLESD